MPEWPKRWVLCSDLSYCESTVRDDGYACDRGENTVIEVIPADLGRELYEALRDGVRPVSGTDEKVMRAEQDARFERACAALARYEREVASSANPHAATGEKG